jgi:hypothetical protein
MTTNNSNRLENVILSLEKVPIDTKEMTFAMARSMSEIEIIKFFNQKAIDLFNFMIAVTKKLGKEQECNNVMGYKTLFDNALKINAKLPLDKFTLIILEYAAEIYAQNEDCFLKMTIPDTKVNINNEFGLIRSEMFKDLWKISGKKDREEVADIVILLTTFAHAHLYKTILTKK